MTPASGLGSSPTSSSPRTQLMNDVRSTEIAPVDTDTPDALGTHGGVVVIVWLKAKRRARDRAATRKRAEVLPIRAFPACR